MHFFSLSSLLVGFTFSALVQSAPSTYARRADLMPRGLPDSAYSLHYMPRGIQRRDKKGGGKDKNKQDIDIEVTDVTEQIKVGKEEIDLEVKVTEILIKNKGNNNKKDNKRKDAAKKNNKKKNTVIQVVQVIVDIRDSQKKKTRYAMHDVTADNGMNATATMMVTDAQTMTVSNQTLCGSNGTVAIATAGASDLVLSDATATATAVMAAATGDIAAPFLMANQTMLLPPDSAAPEAPADGSVMVDPAIDLSIQIMAADGTGTACV